MLIYCIMTKKNNSTRSLDLVSERASYWQSYQAFAGHDWPVTDSSGNHQVPVIEISDEDAIMDVKPVGGRPHSTKTFACHPGTPHPRRERLI